MEMYFMAITGNAFAIRALNFNLTGMMSTGSNVQQKKYEYRKAWLWWANNGCTIDMWVKAIRIMSVHYINSIVMIGWLKMIIYAFIIVIWIQ